MNHRWQISRRTMLRGIGAAVSLPMLEVMSPNKIFASQKRQNPPVRAAYLYFPNGVAEGGWQPEKVAEDGKLQKLNKWMKPLESLKEEIIIPKNMWTPHGNGHSAGTATWLTGSGYDDEEINAGEKSVDQLAAEHVGRETLLPSLELSMRGEGYFSNSLPRNTISWTSENTPAGREIVPRTVFDRMFRKASGEISDKSILDRVLEDARSLRRRVSLSDQRKVDEYLEALHSIERRIEFADRQAGRAEGNQALSASLKRPAPGIPADHGEYMRVMLDLIVMAFWSDATRVCTFMLDHGQSNRYFNFIDGVQGTWHALSHYKDISGKTEDDDGKTSWSSLEQKRDMYNAVTGWHNEQVAYFLTRLKKIEEPNGTLLDNSMVLYGSSLSDGHEHGAKSLPLLLAGKGGRTIKSGRQLAFTEDTSMSNLHLSMLHRLGVEIDEFGDSDEPLTELER